MASPKKCVHTVTQAVIDFLNGHRGFHLEQIEEEDTLDEFVEDLDNTIKEAIGD